MKNVNKTFVLLLATGILSFGMTSCGESKKKSEEAATPEATEMHMDHDMNHEDMDHEMDPEAKEGDMAMAANFKDKEVEAAFGAYLSLKDALVATDAGAAATAAKILSEKAANNEALANAAGTIAASTDVEAQRKAFETVTEAMGEMLEGALESGEIYKQYCPMAFNNAGAAWFSAEKEIMNPYFGNKMLHCGTVKETIK
ncbi:DUF3347 domain-containing protein [Robertkochia sediminum]|uniref:DUF3347 domain-containing protein n=1 Tax=Robertkochia sediminum TaxID=2785326 RepID=UPI0019324C75|nr:DUF3347 domain-containing protein [Robertkochia sediminum]MBL7471509.1 DUF3347 domain-containing protein [Robertkochia sediminum]